MSHLQVRSAFVGLRLRPRKLTLELDVWHHPGSSLADSLHTDVWHHPGSSLADSLHTTVAVSDGGGFCAAGRWPAIDEQEIVWLRAEFGRPAISYTPDDIDGSPSSAKQREGHPPLLRPARRVVVATVSVASQLTPASMLCAFANTERELAHRLHH